MSEIGGQTGGMQWGNLELVLIGYVHGFSCINFPQTRQNFAGGLSPVKKF